MSIKKPLKVIAAMSGGVDSSVSAAILKNKGYEVVGVFMKFWKESGKGQENKCCSVEAQRDARKVATKFKIPFYTLNCEKEFKKRVVDYFINEYKKCRTPNPCIECNRWIKFKFLLEKALRLKADYIATGHYARAKNGKLLVAKDKQKDQSYFLWALNQKQLSRILFPLGKYTKEQVRGLAKRFGLPVSEKKDSQEICFIQTTIEDFLKKYIKPKKGPIITTEGKKVGEHEGLVFYTIGQRKGIKIGGIGLAPPSQGGPFYVVRKDFKNNALIVSKSEKDLLQKEMVVKNINWILRQSFSGKCGIKIRSMAQIVPARIMNYESGIRNCVKVEFDKPQRAITPGQSVIFYRGNEVLGGGIIKN